MYRYQRLVPTEMQLGEEEIFLRNDISTETANNSMVDNCPDFAYV